ANPSSLEGKLRRLPRSLAESLEAFRRNKIIQEFIGKKLSIAIMGIRKAEIEYYSNDRDAYKKLIHRY
ncbi:hypothetical protein CRG98_031055, partial [Punica granatum]